MRNIVDFTLLLKNESVIFQTRKLFDIIMKKENETKCYSFILMLHFWNFMILYFARHVSEIVTSY